MSHPLHAADIDKLILRVPVFSAILWSTIVLHSADGRALLSDLGHEQTLLSAPDDGNPGTMEDFDWNRAPHPDATGNFIFASMSSLLELWPNTAYRVGHTVVPVTMSKGTLMYHGRDYPAVPGPKESDWMAFDFEHSYMFASLSALGPGYVYEYVATRDLKLLYFDGSSAAKVLGAFDSQDVVVDHKVHKDLSWEYEMQRLQRLCMWGKPLGVDGFMRMEFHFEVMYCDFTDGFDLVQVIDVIPHVHCNNLTPVHSMDPEHNATNTNKTSHLSSSPNSDPCSNPPPGWVGRLPAVSLQDARVAGKWHDFAPGETRVRPDYSSAVTFYDTALRSLVEARRGQTRSQHRLFNITFQDADMKIKELEDVLTREKRPVDGAVNWGSNLRTVIERYGQRLELLNDTLASDDHNVTQKAGLVRQQLLTMMLPYLTRSDVAIRVGDPSSHAWLVPAMRRCSTTLPDSIPTTFFTPQERLIHNALKETLHEICRRVSRAFSAAFDIGEIPGSQISAVLEHIEQEVHELMEWLGWKAAWSKCKPACRWDEMCVLPTWPYELLELDNMVPRCKSMFDWF